MEKYSFHTRFSERGFVVSVGDGIIWVKGLGSAAIDELLELEDGSSALVFYLTVDLIGAVLLTQSDKLTAGTVVYHANKILSAPVGDKLLGRVIDPLGNALDGKEEIKVEDFEPLDVLSPGIINRDFVTEPLYTGNKIIDNLIPIGKGQRELLIGDNGLGKTAIALDAVINQKNKNVLCVYVLIGQKRSTISNILQILHEKEALEHTVLVVAEATALPGLLYLAPFSGCTMAEYWMKKGRDTLVIYDDLTIHADSYRELSLLLKKPPGREAYPPDIFYLHARLLERSTCLAAELGGGSMTALPIIETKQGEIASYIPTNLISITDGQIYLDARLFDSGFLPAIDIKLSVSRIGGKAQHDKVKDESSRIKLDYLQFLELEEFTKFGAKLDEKTAKKITAGKILRELLKQPRLNPINIEAQLAVFIAYNEGLFNDVQEEKIASVAAKLQDEIKRSSIQLNVSREEWLRQIKKIIK